MLRPGSRALVATSTANTTIARILRHHRLSSSRAAAAAAHPWPRHRPTTPRSRWAAGPSSVTVRGKKTRTTVSLRDLPQGTIPLDPSSAELDAGASVAAEEPAYPTVVQQARRNMQRFDQCVLLTRVGGFYELYFEHADEYGPLLNLKVAQKRTSAGPVPMVALA